jgi:glycosyltransferase involved in cell wall biosynthesis
MRLGFVVQRYGLEVNGGAELYARELAERLAARSDISTVTIFTTTARDHESWQNHYPAGRSDVNGLPVHRFPTLFPRLRALQSVAGLLGPYGLGRSAAELPWIIAQGPYCPGLVRHLRAEAPKLDVIVFFSYLYYPTLCGLPPVCERALLVPTAHDEPPIRMRRVKRMIERARAVGFLAPEERDLVGSLVDLSRMHTAVIGAGVSMPEVDPGRRPHERPYLLYLGRIEKGKGVVELAAGFRRFKERYATAEMRSDRGPYQGRELDLVLAGRQGEPCIEPGEDVLLPGFVPDADRVRWIAHAEALVIPGLLDSFSLSLLEAWLLGRPTLVPEACPVKRGHVKRARTGELYGASRPFEDALALVLREPERRAHYAERGRGYVREQYAWPVVVDRFLELARFVAERSRGAA